MASKTKKETVIKVEPNPEHKLLEESAIENSGKEKKKGFFTLRNVIILSFFFALSIALLALTIVFILRIDFAGLFETISNGFNSQLGILWFLLLFLYLIYQLFANYATLWVRLRKLGYHISQWEYWLFGGTNAFLRAVLPVLFSDPYTLFWLKTKGVPTSRATSLLFSNTLFWQFVQFAVTFPSFVFVLANRGSLLTSANGITAFSFLCAGIFIDFLSILFMVLLNMSRKMHSGLSKIFNGIKKRLHMKYHTKAEIEEKYKNQATIRRDFVEYMKDWRTTLFIVCIFVLSEMVLYFAVTWAMYFVQFTSLTDAEVIKQFPQYKYTLFQANFDFWWAFHSANVTFTANRLNFILPNGEGTLQLFLSTFLVNLSNFNIVIPSLVSPQIISDDIPVEVVNSLTGSVTNNAILIWRTFGAYFPAAIGLCCLAGLTTKQIRKYKKSHKVIEA